MLATTKRLRTGRVRTTKDAVRAIEHNPLQAEVREITNPTDYAALLKLLSAPRLFGIVV